MTDLAGKRVFVGLSGGVDSAVSAALLQRAGANVVGVFIKGWYPPGIACTWSEDRADAMRAAAHLGIPFHTLDASTEYKQGVIDYLLREYAAGRTPNPDVMCNREVKFGAFWRFAKERGADFVATGHYVQQEGGTVMRGADAAKDQSYFLWAVPKEALRDTLFPVGSFPKERTRERARQFGIPQAAKKDSQGICFLGSISVDDFLRSELGATRGVAVSEDGREVGTHDGAVLATLGERVAISGSSPGPWYVVRKDMLNNTLTVSHTQKSTQSTDAITLTETNWLQTIATDEVVQAQYRYHGPLVEGRVDTARSLFTPLIPIAEPLASGQSLVLYRKDELLGGGIIV
jgi:tRNA-specific 2-thiouridylase